MFLIYLYVIINANFDVSSGSPKHVLMVIFDDLRPALGCYGDGRAVTPNIDSIAAEGILFDQAFAQLYDFYNYWRETVGNYTTIPQYFKEHGYYTKSIGKVFHPGVSSNFSDDQPYSWSEVPFHPTTEEYKNAAVCYSEDDPFVAHSNVICPVTIESQPGCTLPDIESTGQAIQFLKNVNNTKLPFFLAIGYHKPHLPLKYPKHFDDYHHLDDIILPKCRTKPEQMPDVAWNPWTDLRERHDIAKLGLQFPYGQVPDEKAKSILRSYYASVTYVDALLGRVMNELKASQIYEDTVIAILGDHGWSLGEHGEWSKYSNFDVATRVPLIFRAPASSTNLVGPEVRSDPVNLLDLFPTISYLAGLPEVPKCGRDSKVTQLCTEGRNLFGRRSQEAFSQYPRPSLSPQKNSDKPKLADIRYMGYSIRTNEYRYTEWVSFKNFTAQWSNIVARELYNHVKDDDEANNVAESPEHKQEPPAANMMSPLDGECEAICS